MNGQLALFDPPAAVEAPRAPVPTEQRAQAGQDRGMARSAQHAGDGWAADAAVMLEAYLALHEFFHVDEFWSWALDRGFTEGPSPRAIGTVIRRAGASGQMTRTRCTAPSVRSHLSHKPVWRSGLYAGRRTNTFRGDLIP